MKNLSKLLRNHLGCHAIDEISTHDYTGGIDVYFSKEPFGKLDCARFEKSDVDRVFTNNEGKVGYMEALYDYQVIVTKHDRKVDLVEPVVSKAVSKFDIKYGVKTANIIDVFLLSLFKFEFMGMKILITANLSVAVISCEYYTNSSSTVKSSCCETVRTLENMIRGSNATEDLKQKALYELLKLACAMNKFLKENV